MPTNINTLSNGQLVLNQGQYYVVATVNGKKVLQLITAAQLATFFTDNSWTLSFSLDTQAWISYHDYTPYLMTNTRNVLYSMNYDEIYKHNISTKYARFYEVGGTQQTYASFVDAVFNEQPDRSKMYATVNWISKTTASNGAHLYNSTITDLLIYNSYQCSGNLDLVRKTSTNQEDIRNFNMFNTEGTWSVNKFRDIVINPDNPFIDSNLELITSNLNVNKDWFTKKRFVDKFIISRFSFDNVSQNSLYLYDVSANMRLSAR
tara:strand:- start:818 stop:1603 length:786 start_codon:yes stop_codon:yes gene_type:complete